jgi:hypothetical protein
MPIASTQNVSITKNISTMKKISIVQSGGLTGNRDADLADLIDLFRQAAVPGTDLVVFPELCTTPYFGATTMTRTKPGPNPLTVPQYGCSPKQQRPSVQL